LQYTMVKLLAISLALFTSIALIGQKMSSAAPAQSGADLAGYTICLDPGHPSETSDGTESNDHSLTELHLNWVEAKDLAPLLAADGAKVVWTKSREHQLVTNRRRAEIANAAGAVLFLRLHCDSASDSGIASYYPDRIGQVDGVSGPSLRVRQESQIAATAFQSAVVGALKGYMRDRGLHGDTATAVGHKQGALTGSIFSQVPAVTVEMCVLTNQHDFELMRTGAGQQLMARALLEGVKAAVSALNPQK
jgi:N-acetylmuramoyl-L-alanine amidase